LSYFIFMNLLVRPVPRDFIGQLVLLRPQCSQLFLELRDLLATEFGLSGGLSEFFAKVLALEQALRQTVYQVGLGQLEFVCYVLFVYGVEQRIHFCLP